MILGMIMFCAGFFMCHFIYRSNRKYAYKQLEISREDGNWNYDPYLHGFHNGMECTLATIDGREPKYREAPAEWIRDKYAETVKTIGTNEKDNINKI